MSIARVLCLLLLLPSLLMASPEQAAKRFVDLINGDTSDQGRVFADAFIAKRGAEGIAQLLEMLADDNGRLTVADVVASSDAQIRFLASSASGQWLNVSLDLDAEQRITGLAVRPTEAPLDPEQQGRTLAEIISLLKDELERRAQNDDFSGTVLLAKDGKPVFAQAYGLADRDSGRENQLDTPFNLGSMNKMFTGVAVAQLVAAGKLDFDAKVGTYLPDYPNETVREQVTLHQLLTHTSGMGLYWNDAYLRSKEQIVDLDGFLATFVDEPLLAPPGTEFHYSNNGPVVLGLVIEAVTGISYYDYVREHIYGPAGMSSADHYDKLERDSGKAIGYYRPPGADAMQSNQEGLGNIGSPAGGGYASAQDMLRFAQALYDGRLLDQRMVAMVTSNKLDQGDGFGYGYLFGDQEVNGRRYIGHNGGAPGINAEFSVFPELGITVIVLSNGDRQATPVARLLRQWIGHAKL